MFMLCNKKKQFKVSTCKRLLKKLCADANSLMETKNSIKKAMREEIAKLLTNGQLNLAHILAEYLIDQEHLRLVVLHIQFFSEQLLNQLLYIAHQRNVPPKLKEAIASLCYAGSWYSELPVLDKVLSQLSLKYGEEYIDNVNKFKADYGVDKEVVKLLSLPKPPLEERNKLLKEIADEFGFLWDPVSVIDTASEDSMSRLEIDTMLRLFNKIPCSNNKQFNFATCKTLLEKAIADAQSLVNTTEKEMDAMPKDIVEVLVNRETRYAQYLAEYLIRERNLCVILRYIIYFCQQVAHYLPYIESRRKVLPEVKEYIAGLCYLGSRCSELPELKMLVSQFSLKYGDYISKVNMLMEDGVNDQIISLFVPKPLVEERNKLIKEFADRFGLKERLIEERNKRITKIKNQFRLAWDQVYVDDDTAVSTFDEDMSSFSDEDSMSY